MRANDAITETRAETWAETWEAGRTPDDFSLPMVGIMAVGGPEGALPEATRQRITPLLADYGGAVVGAGGGVLGIAFRRLDDATAFARRLHIRHPGELRLGVSLGALDKAGDIDFAESLSAMARPGETCISAVTGNHLSARVRAKGQNEPPGWKLYILPEIGLSCFLGYYFGWFYAIYWKLAYYVTNQHFPCWPEFMCR